MEVDLRYADLHACVSCLGFTEEDGSYKKDVDADESLKDILRYLRRENTSCDIRRELGKLKIVSSDLIPMLITYPEDDSLLDLIVRLLMNVTQPAFICFKQELPKDRDMRGYYIQVDELLKEYKKNFVNTGLMTILSSKIGALIDKSWEDRSEEDRVLIERILIILRNILHVSPDPNQEQRTDEDVSIHDQVLWAMHEGGWDDLLLFLSNSNEEQSFAFHTLEIISLMFREQTPEILSQAGSQGSLADDHSLKILERAKFQEQEKQKDELRNLNIRHNRYGGTYQMLDVQSLSEKPLIYHHDVTKSEFTLDKEKKERRIPKNRRPITEKEVVRRSTLTIRLHLKEFCWKFLQFCYNPLMKSAKYSLQRETSQADDETYFLWAMRFFSSFCRLYQFKVDLISETLSMESFHWIYEQMMQYFEKVKLDKPKALQWSRRLQLSLAAYKELLHCLSEMKKSSELAVKHSAETIITNIFYSIEYREVFPLLLKNFDETKQSRTYLRDLIEGSHLMIKLLQMQAESGALIVKKKSKIRKKNKSKPLKSRREEDPLKPTEQELESKWDSMADVLSSAIQGDMETPPPESLPVLFDASREDVSEKDQLKSALVLIKNCLHNNEPLKALALLRIARDLWAEEPALADEDDYLALRQIHLSELENEEGKFGHQEEGNSGDDEEEGAVEYSECISHPIKEVTLDTKEYLNRFAHPDVIDAYCILLRDYSTNSCSTNACILRMLYRLAVTLKLPSLLYQIKIFRLFNIFIKDPLSTTREFKEWRKFILFVMRKYFQHLKDNNKLVLEILFTRSLKESIEVMSGYGTQDKGHNKNQWTEELDSELQRLWEEHKDDELTPGRDLADIICESLSDNTKTRRHVIIRMAYLGLIGSAKDLKKAKAIPKSRKEWTEDEIDLLKRLIDENVESRDPLANIRANLPVKRSRFEVVNKALEMDFISSADQLKYTENKRRNKRLRESEKERGPSSKRPKTLEEEPRIISEEFIHSSEDDSSTDDENYDPMQAVLQEKMMGNRQTSAAPTTESNGSSTKSKPRKTKSPKMPKKLKSFQPSARKNIQIQINRSEIRRLKDSVLERAVTWLIDEMECAIEDRSGGILEAIPLVAVNNDDAECLAQSESEALLRHLGFTPPDATQGERYWRIPSEMSAGTLRELIALLKGEIPVPQDEEEMEEEIVQSSAESSSSSSDEENSTIVDPSANPNETSLGLSLLDSDLSDNANTTDENKPSMSKPKSKRKTNLRKNSKSKIVKSDSDSDSKSKKIQSSSKIKKNRKLIVDSSDSDNDPVEDIGQQEVTTLADSELSQNKEKRKCLKIVDSSDSEVEQTAPVPEKHSNEDNSEPILSNKVLNSPDNSESETDVFTAKRSWRLESSDDDE